MIENVGIVGSIPAHAGETVAHCLINNLCQVYPRARGGNRYSFRFFKSVGGLSPRTRGKPRRPSLPVIWIRSIPAHAGETHCFGDQGDGGRSIPAHAGETAATLLQAVEP